MVFATWSAVQYFPLSRVSKAAGGGSAYQKNLVRKIRLYILHSSATSLPSIRVPTRVYIDRAGCCLVPSRTISFRTSRGRIRKLDLFFSCSDWLLPFPLFYDPSVRRIRLCLRNTNFSRRLRWGTNGHPRYTQCEDPYAAMWGMAIASRRC